VPTFQYQEPFLSAFTQPDILLRCVVSLTETTRHLEASAIR